MRLGIWLFVRVFFALVVMMSISPNAIRLSGGNECKLAMARRLDEVEINDYHEPEASVKHRPAPPGDQVGDKLQEHQEPSSSYKHFPQSTNEDGLV